MQIQESGISEMLTSITSLGDKEFLQYPKLAIKDLPKDVRSIQLTLLMTKLSNLAGIKGEVDNVNAQDISQMINKRFKSLSVADIDKAFQKERYSEYDVKTDHFQLFNADYVGAILKKYVNWKKKRRVYLKIQPIQEVKKELPPPLKPIQEIAEEVKSVYLKCGKIDIQFYVYWRKIWFYFYAMEKEEATTFMERYRERAEKIVNSDHVLLKKHANKPKPTETEYKRKMAELSLKELWKL